MPYEPHANLIQPEDNNAYIWRFIDLPKFLDMLVTGSLYFARGDMFEESVRRDAARRVHGSRTPRRNEHGQRPASDEDVSSLSGRLLHQLLAHVRARERRNVEVVRRCRCRHCHQIDIQPAAPCLQGHARTLLSWPNQLRPQPRFWTDESV